MSHFLVDQLRFSRRELQRCLDGVTDEEARQRLQPMNCISWMIGHLATQENSYWVMRGLGKQLHPELYELVGHGRPASTPPLAEMWAAWQDITTEADKFLDTLTPEIMQTYFQVGTEQDFETIGTRLLRCIHHYWFHIGEAHAVRQMLEHTDLPQFVGDLSTAGYQPEK
ncbi:MAG: DinB family protein [Anaerolineales bacterium]|nr:DinB family protein [Anaerolineales bacterium]